MGEELEITWWVSKVCLATMFASLAITLATIGVGSSVRARYDGPLCWGELNAPSVMTGRSDSEGF